MKTSDYLQYTDVKKIIDSNKLHYLICIGQRSNGKSYACKELALRNAAKGEQFCYLRRHKEDIQDYMILEYFADMLVPDKKGRNAIQKITKDKYNSIAVFRKGIYFAVTDEEKTVRGEQAGFAHALSGLEGLKSRQFPNVTLVIFEEFIATGLYLWEECNKLQQYASTIYRTRPGCIIMIGNTISRIVPYFTEWQLDNIPKQEQGTVDVYKFHTEVEGNNIETRIGVFLCGSLKHNSGMFFGQSAKMIVGGLWDRSEQPKPDKPVEDYETVYTAVFQFSEKAVFLMTLLQDRKDHERVFWYVQPKTTEVQQGTRVISPRFNPSPLYTVDFVPLTEAERPVWELFKLRKIAYSDNLTGTEFQRCLDQMKKR